MLQEATPVRRALKRPLGRLGAGSSRPLRGASGRGGVKETPARRFPRLHIRIQARALRNRPCRPRGAQGEGIIPQAALLFAGCFSAPDSVIAPSVPPTLAKCSARFIRDRLGRRGQRSQPRIVVNARRHDVAVQVEFRGGSSRNGCARSLNDIGSDPQIWSSPQICGAGWLTYRWTCSANTHTLVASGRLLTYPGEQGSEGI
jgi:hypothetical protein